MDFQSSFSHLIIVSLLCLQATADGTGYVRFLDSPVRQYFRPFSTDVVSETNSMLLPEVGAAVSVLLGFAPPATLSAASSSKLNEVLMPNPFDKPRAVFMLNVRGVEVHADSQVMDQSVYTEFGGALSSRVIVGSTKADIQLPDEGEVSVVSLNKPLSFDSDVELTDKELSEFASFLGGTYVADALERMNGEFTIPLASGAHLNLHMSKKADREFIESLLSLVHNTRRAMDVHEDLSGSMRNPAELIMGSFDGIKVLQEEYGSEGVTPKGLELLSASISKIFESLQTVRKGQIVGVILFSGTASQESETLLNVMFTSQHPARWLEETKGLSGQTIVEVLLVRTILAWLTGIILLIATLMGEALQKLGFYSGEEDMEFSSFSSGTERAVKTWQATLGAREDGIMTAELQERLYMEPQMGGSGLAVNADPKRNDVTAPKVGVNGAAFASITEISEIQKTVVEEEGITEVDVSEHRVFLLGENRWEEPSSLTGGNKQGGAKSKNSTTKCLSCRGEGRILCMECDGTGEPNIEPQFMEWVDEGTKGPYCEGLGYTICDVCEGKALV